MKYLVLKTLPIKGLEKDSIAESTNYKGIEFTNTEYFALYIECSYVDTQKVVYMATLCSIVSHRILYGKVLYSLQAIHQVGRWKDVPENRITVATFFHFINSDGQVCLDYEERATLKKDALAWRKASGNYFATAAAANEMRTSIICAPNGKIK